MDTSFLDTVRSDLLKLHAVLDAAQKNETVESIVARFPIAGKFLSGAIAAENFAEKIVGFVPQVQGAIAVIDELKALGMEPADPGRDKGYEERGRAPQE